MTAQPCRIHLRPRPCRECRDAARVKPRKRVPFLGTPRKGWTPVLPADKQTAIAADWGSGTSGGKRTRTMGQRLWVEKSKPVAAADPGSELLSKALLLATQRGWPLAELEQRAKLGNKMLRNLIVGRLKIGPRTRQRLEALIGGEP